VRGGGEGRTEGGLGTGRRGATTTTTTTTTITTTTTTTTTITTTTTTTAPPPHPVKLIDVVPPMGPINPKK